MDANAKVPAKPKAKIAFFDFSSCEGCQIELTNLGSDVFTELLEHVEFVEFREVMSERATGPIDIAFIEGAFTRESDRARLESIRGRARVVVAYGSCAATGGITSLKNHMPDYARAVYGEDASQPHLASQAARPISDAIAVDHHLYGCPISRDEFVRYVSELLHGVAPEAPNHPVCVECKLRETVCRYQTGDHCLGLVARAGCGAPCPADGIPCEACRGYVDHPNEAALSRVLQERGGLSAERADGKTLLFAAEHRGRGEA